MGEPGEDICGADDGSDCVKCHDWVTEGVNGGHCDKCFDTLCEDCMPAHECKVLLRDHQATVEASVSKSSRKLITAFHRLV